MFLTSLRSLICTAATLSIFVAGCGSDTSGSGGTGGSGGAGGGAGGTGATGGTGGTGGAGGSGGVGGTGGVGGGESTLDTVDKINAYLDGKTLTMGPDAVPTDPNGFNENVNFGNATQCYNKVTIKTSSALWNVTSDLGTLNDAPMAGDVGTCDHATVSGTVMFDSTAILFENVTATCFDITATYVGFSQEGRGRFSADGKTVDLEFYFGGQAAGHRCADGAVGDPTVKIKGADFTGDAVQSYTVE